MADINDLEKIRDNEPKPVFAGGPRRPSVRVNLKKFAPVRERQRINRLLLECTCAFDRTEPHVFKAGELKMLQQIALERDPHGNPVLRREAVTALGRTQSIEALQTLWTIAASDFEHDAIRGHALLSLARIAPALAPVFVAKVFDEKSRALRQMAVTALRASVTEASVSMWKRRSKASRPARLRAEKRSAAHGGLPALRNKPAVRLTAKPKALGVGMKGSLFRWSVGATKRRCYHELRWNGYTQTVQCLCWPGRARRVVRGVRRVA